MKILNVEKGKLTAYVQRKNLKSLIRYDERLPRKFYKFAKELGLSDKDESLDEDFIKTTDKKLIKVLLSADWIIDLRDLHDLSDEEIQNSINELIKKIQDLDAYYSSLSYQEQRMNPYTPVQLAKAKDKLNDINAYYQNKQEKYHTPFEIPLAIDSKAGIVSSNKDLKIGRSLDHKKILIARQDNQPFQEGYNINPVEVNMGLMVLMMEENLTPTTPGELKLNIKSEPTNTYLIAEYTFEQDKDYVPETVEAKAPTRLKPNQKIKTIFN